jgi:hypothetical protein
MRRWQLLQVVRRAVGAERFSPAISHMRCVRPTRPTPRRASAEDLEQLTEARCRSDAAPAAG